MAGVLACAAMAQAQPRAGYRLAWSDEFEGAALDTSKWAYRTDSKHWSTQKPENVTVTGGTLRLHVRKEPAGDKHYTGAGVISTQLFRYGYYEARFKVPPGAGWHTSFWMMWHNGRGGTDTESTVLELDAFENDSIHQMGYWVNTHLWNPTPHQSFGHKHVATAKLSEDFHLCGCLFTPQSIHYTFDGKTVQTVGATQFPHDDLHIWLTTIASHFGPTEAVDDLQLPANAEFDYVRFYEKAE